jgi:peptide/nickel transport system permease protein
MKITGDPLADLKLNPSISQEKINAETKRLGLDKPVHLQYLSWLINLGKGDLGLSQNNQRVIDVIKPALLNTLLLNIVALFFTWLIAVLFGVLTAVFKDSWLDSFINLVNSILMSSPSFLIAIFMLIIALYSGCLPIGGLTSSNFDELNIVEKFFDIAKHLILPVVILVLLGFTSVQKQMQANLLDVLNASYIRTAKAKGLSYPVIIIKHALRNAINPLITMFGFEFAGLFAGSGIIEMIISYPGLGHLTLEAARKLDVNLVLANLLLGSMMLVLGNLLADLLLYKLDPRSK